MGDWSASSFSWANGRWYKIVQQSSFFSWFGEFRVALSKALTLLFMKIQSWHRYAANYLTSMSMWPQCTGKANLTICTWLLGYTTSNRVSAILERYQPWGGTHWQRQSRGSQSIGASGNRSCWTFDPQISSYVCVWGRKKERYGW